MTSLAPGTVVASRFRIEREAGRGGMGAVFEALDLSSGDRVALKLLLPLSPTSERRFQREAEILRTIADPAIAAFVASGRARDGRAWLAMEWIDGAPLSSFVDPTLPLPHGAAVDLVERLATALGGAHNRGIVHRDIKPANVMVPVDGGLTAAKLVDFGVARLAGVTRLTATGRAVGTLGYMPPEQLLGCADVDGRCDVYALGVLLFVLLSGRLPIEGEGRLEIAIATVDRPAPRLREIGVAVPAALEELVANALARAPEDRPADGGALGAALRAVRASVTGVRPGQPGPVSPEAPTATDAWATSLDRRHSERHLRLLDAVLESCVEDAVAEVVVIRGGDAAARRALVSAFVRRVAGTDPGLPVLAVQGDAEATADELVTWLGARDGPGPLVLIVDEADRHPELLPRVGEALHSLDDHPLLVLATASGTTGLALGEERGLTELRLT